MGFVGDSDWGSLEISWGLGGGFFGFTRALLGANWGFVVDLMGLGWGFCGFTRALLGAHWGFVVGLMGLIGGKLRDDFNSTSMKPNLLTYIYTVMSLLI